VGLRASASGSGSAAAIFTGNVQVMGTLTKSAGSFKIDDPLDPRNRFLSHSFVESPDMKNIYDGIVTTDHRGLATVTMPVWFNALNGHFRYKLTVVGRSSPVRSSGRSSPTGRSPFAAISRASRSAGR
jgi:hypothetical protein